MVSNNAPQRAQQSGGTHITRRTVTRGVAWSAPIAAVAYAAPAFAASPPPVVGSQCGTACKHPGAGQNDKAYHFTFCFTANGAIDNNTITLGNMFIDTVPRQAYSGENVTTITVLPNTTVCQFVDAPSFTDSASGQGKLLFSYSIGGVQFQGCAQATIIGDVCGTSGSSPLKDQPKNWPHEATGPGVQSGCTPTPGTCL